MFVCFFHGFTEKGDTRKLRVCSRQRTKGPPGLFLSLTLDRRGNYLSQNLVLIRGKRNPLRIFSHKLGFVLIWSLNSYGTGNSKTLNQEFNLQLGLKYQSLREHDRHQCKSPLQGPNFVPDPPRFSEINFQEKWATYSKNHEYIRHQKKKKRLQKQTYKYFRYS